MHGSIKINFHTLEEMVDRKLLDPTIGKAEWYRWNAVMQALLANKPQVLRMVKGGKR